MLDFVQPQRSKLEGDRRGQTAPFELRTVAPFVWHLARSNSAFTVSIARLFRVGSHGSNRYHTCLLELRSKRRVTVHCNSRARNNVLLAASRWRVSAGSHRHYDAAPRKDVAASPSVTLDVGMIARDPGPGRLGVPWHGIRNIHCRIAGSPSNAGFHRGLRLAICSSRQDLRTDRPLNQPQESSETSG